MSSCLNGIWISSRGKASPTYSELVIDIRVIDIRVVRYPARSRNYYMLSIRALTVEATSDPKTRTI